MPGIPPDAPVRLDAQVFLDAHPAHPTAVIARLTGSHYRTAQALLTAHGFDSLDEHPMVLARIDREEPHWAQKATHALHAEGITAEITPSLQEAIDEEWPWITYPDPRPSRDEIRGRTDQAQKIHDAIRDGRLVIHAHAHADTGWDTVAVGTYRDSGKSVHLRGENHLRRITHAFVSPAQALTAFEQAHVVPGPAPMTDTEGHTAHARTSLAPPDTAPTATAAPLVKRVPAYAADPGDQEAVFNVFLDNNGDWEKYQTFSNDTTHVIDESQTLRIQLLHEADPREDAWTIAAYETPVSDQMWHLTLTANTPAGPLNSLLISLAHGEWDTSLDSPITEKSVAQTPAPSPTPAGHPRHKDTGCTGSPPRKTPDSRSTPSPPRTRTPASLPGPSGQATTPTGPPGPSMRPPSLLLTSSPTSPKNSPTKSAPAGPALSNRPSTSARSAQHPRHRPHRIPPKPAIDADVPGPQPS